MSLTLFRGDSRKPEEIENAGGFYAWVPLSADQARALIRKALGATVDNEVFPTALQDALKGVTINNTTDLLPFIKYTKNKSTTPQVSTAPDEDCGGQANGTDAKGRKYIVYEIQFENLNVLEKTGVRPATSDDIRNGPAVKPKILVDGNDLVSSDTIAVIFKDEIAFLTAIPVDNITRYNNGEGWSAM
jgi:hypothetical protein